jgi:hypothetical protein
MSAENPEKGRRSPDTEGYKTILVEFTVPALPPDHPDAPKRGQPPDDPKPDEENPPPAT